eukprot:2657987-Amphidinium_carterae.1
MLVRYGNLLCAAADMASGHGYEAASSSSYVQTGATNSAGGACGVREKRLTLWFLMAHVNRTRMTGRVWSKSFRLCHVGG